MRQFSQVIAHGALSIGLVTALSVVTGRSNAAEHDDHYFERGRIQRFVPVGHNRELYVDFIKPAPGHPIAVLLNGLTYKTSSWDAFTEQLRGDGLGILRYDPMGQGETLLKYGFPIKPIDYKDQVADLAALLKALKINSPVHLITLSYGGAIGMQFAVEFPKQVASLVLLAPFVAPLDGQDLWIRTQILQTRFMFPYNPSTDYELYDFFLKSIVYTTYPAAEPIVLENPYKLEATFRLVQGVRRFEAVQLVDDLPSGKVHLIVARHDQYVENAVHDRFWEQVPNTKKASRLYIQGTEHKIPEAVPHFSAEWIKLIISGDSRLLRNKTFEGGPWSGNVRSGRTVIAVP